MWLPGTLVVGLGIGLTFPVLSAAAVSSLEAERFAVGSAVNQTARQVGGALGVAVLVVVLGSPATPAAALAAFHHLWWCAAGRPRPPVSCACSSAPGVPPPRQRAPAHAAAGAPSSVRADGPTVLRRARVAAEPT